MTSQAVSQIVELSPRMYKGASLNKWDAEISVS